MEDKLVTVAIHTYEKAQILKTLLESEGIETYIHNVNLIEPTFSAGVRVRIKESDLTRALSIIVKMIKADEELTTDSKMFNNESKILLPVDFSDYSIKACDIAFQLALSMKAEVTLLHTYFTPAYGNIPILDTVSYSSNDDETIRIVKKVNADMENLTNMLNRKIDKGTLPNIKFKTVLREGVPEEEIIKFSKEYNPSIIIMGTRGKNRKDLDLIGSVTAEVIERSDIPVFAIPEDILLKDLKNIKNVAFATNFDGNDLMAFEKMMNILKIFTFKVYFIHIQQDQNKWDEIKLVGIKEYFTKQYPNLDTEYCLIKGKDVLKCIDNFIVEKNIDIVVRNGHKRSVLSRLFNPSISRKMVFNAKTLMLIFHV